MTPNQLISDTKLNEVFNYEYHGYADKREAVKFSLLKAATDIPYPTEAKHCLYRLKLLTSCGAVSKKGRRYLFYSFKKTTKL